MTSIAYNKKTPTWLIILSILTLIAFMAYMSGCMTPKRIEKFKALYCNDSISVQIKDNIVKVPVYYQDSAFMQLYLECDSAGQVYFNSWQDAQGRYIEMKRKLENNKLTVISHVKIHDTVQIITHDTIIKQQANTITNILTKGQRRMITFAWVCIGIFSLLIIYAGYRVYRYFRNKSISLKNYIQKIK